MEMEQLDLIWWVVFCFGFFGSAVPPIATDVFQHPDHNELKKCPENNPELEFQINTGAIFGVLTPIVKFSHTFLLPEAHYSQSHQESVSA